MSVTHEESEAVTKHDGEAELVELKMRKSRKKAAFTRYSNRLEEMCQDDTCLKSEMKTALDKLESAMDEATDVIDEMITFFKVATRTEEMMKVCEEMKSIESRYDEVVKEYRLWGSETGSVKSGGKSVTVESSPKMTGLGNDMWKQLKRVSIPIFHGDKRQYQSWKAAFTACIDDAPATPQYKLLQLRQYLAGDALKTIGNLGHSEASYTAAKERLERKFGGQRRQIASYMQELDQFPKMFDESSEKIEKFADLLDIAAINLIDANKEEDLGNGSLYIKVQSKMPQSMLTRYHRWVGENGKPESLLTLRAWVITESQYITIASETVRGIDSRPERPPRYKRQEQRTLFSNNSREKGNNQKYTKQNCAMCDGPHGIWYCQMFKQLEESKRWEKAKEHNLCFRCLGSGHMGSTCPRSRVCGVDQCRKNHHRLLHKNGTTNAQQEGVNNGASFPQEGEHTHVGHTNKVTRRSSIALRTVPVVVSSGYQRMTINALLDDGSTKSYLNSNVASTLGLQGTVQTVQVNVPNGKQETFETMPISIGVESLNSQVKMQMEVNTINSVTGNLKAVNWNKHSNKWKHLRGLTFPVVDNENSVDMLIGLDYADLHASIHEIRGQPGEPVARLTPLGWTCVGDPMDGPSKRNDTLFATYFLNASDNQEMNDLVKGFWEVDSYGTQSKDLDMSLQDKRVLETTEQSIRYTDDNRYEVNIPWKSQPEMPDNYSSALKRLKSTEKKLDKDPVVAKMYQETILKYEQKGYIRKVPCDEPQPESKWYLPHFPVVRLDKATTKVRIVFDAAAKCDGVCLNEFIHQGPKLQNDLFDVLLGFRKYETALVCDISEMYLQVGIVERDRAFHRFLWNSNSIIEYEFNRLVFGVNASPFLAQFVAQNNARLCADVYPEAAETVINATYMDDSMISVVSAEKGVEMYMQLTELWKKAGMHARKWLSNSRHVLEHIPQEDRATEVDLDTGYLPTTKTLGVTWQAECDQFTFKISMDTAEIEKITKRNVLKAVARLFDPIGFVSPYVIRGKMLIQKLWSSGFDWDDEVDNELALEVEQWLKGLPILNSVTVPRSLMFNPANELSTCHVFVDASAEAYGAVMYIRHERSDNTTCIRFVSSKTRVAPLNSTSIPRLELMAATLGLRMAVTIAKALDVSIKDTVFWSDSMNVLWWIHGQSRRYKPFVANRVGEIHDRSEPAQWRYVPTGENPADIASRGLTASELVESSLWWDGPSFLALQPDQWPKNKMKQQSDHVDSRELKKDYVQTTETYLTSDNQNTEDRLNPNRYSDWCHLTRVFGWVNRFITNCRSGRERTTSRELTRDEIGEAEGQLIHRAQIEIYPQEYQCLIKGQALPQSSKLVSLNVKLDENGIMKGDTRLKYADFLSYDARFPIVLPRKHRVTKLIVKHFHELGGHYGTNQTLAALSLRFWIVLAREEIREWERECASCRKAKSRAEHQIMAPLPEARLGKSMRAFAYCSVDYGGPFLTKQGRGKSRQKRYLCLFTCMSSRAVHLEMAYSLDTDSFLNAFYRMASRRNYPIEIYSDNGTNFVGAKNELQSLYDKLDKNKITQNGVINGVNWHFNPPAAPHFGGVHESMIKSAKRAIYAILNNAEVTDEDLLTAFVGAEGLINSRPIAYQTANPAEDSVLTPNHFMHGQMGGRFAPDSVDDTVFDVRKRWRRVQEIMKHFWNRWLREFLPTLSGRKKWFHDRVDFEVGDVVLVIDPEKPRGQWSLGRVCEVFPGVDGHVRVVQVRIGNAIFKRAITRLCLLEKAVSK